ncbi:MAG: hypothetical protein J6K44_05090, partial [Clostridia bacterium]|nr:hypothetical protein [Clostridia bacterium]
MQIDSQAFLGGAFLPNKHTKNIKKSTKMRLNCPRYNDIIILTKENAAVFIIGVRNKGGAMEGKRTLGYLTRTILILLICLLTLA